jgi:hypothetical protein
MTDLRDLNGSALAARLDLVKERVLEDAAAANPYDQTELSTAKTKAQLAAERADTEAVLDECAARLVAPRAQGAGSSAGSAGELDRLRALIRAVVSSHGGPGTDGPRCGGSSSDDHGPGCAWPSLLAEIKKP